MNYSQSFTGVPSSLEETRVFINKILKEMNWTDREIDLQLAIGEVTQNVVRYGFKGGDPDGVFTLDIEIDDKVLTCAISDNAPPSNPDDWMIKAEARRPDEGGYGLSIIDAIADQYTVTPGDTGNISRTAKV
ncbi:MAG: ATP-binding protein [Alphaproteobacteria bacterium]|nr:ATP-binding protein [Alphaproteobacteria bacterium]